MCHLGTEYQLAVTLPTLLPTLINIVISRHHPDFSEYDRFALNLLRPHFGRALETAEWLTLVRRTYANPALVIADLGHNVQFASGAAPTWLTEYLSPESRGLCLPVEIRVWADKLLRHVDEYGIVDCSFESILVRRGARSFRVRFISKGRAGNNYALLVEQHVDDLPALMEGFHLRPREADVLYWLIKGKSDSEIAALLSLSVRTVEKHLENIYERLGVHSRTAAIARALESTRG